MRMDVRLCLLLPYVQRSQGKGAGCLQLCEMIDHPLVYSVYVPHRSFFPYLACQTIDPVEFFNPPPMVSELLFLYEKFQGGTDIFTFVNLSPIVIQIAAIFC